MAQIVAVHEGLTRYGDGDVDVPLVGTGANRLIVIVGTTRATGSSGFDECRFGAVNAAITDTFEAKQSDYATSTSIAIFTNDKHPGAGLATLTLGWAGAANASITVYELEDAPQSSPFYTMFHTIIETTIANGAVLTQNVTGQTGNLGIAFLGMGDSSAFDTSAAISANLANGLKTDNNYALLHTAQVASIADADEDFTFTVTLNSGSAPRQGVLGVMAFGSAQQGAGFVNRFATTTGEFDVDPVPVTLNGSGTNRAILAFIIARTQATAGAEVTGVTLNGVAGELFYAPSATTQAAFAIAYWNDAQHPGAGSFDMLMTFSNNVVDGNCLGVIEADDAPQNTSGFIHATAEVGASVAADALFNFSTDIAGAVGELVIPYIAMADSTYWDPLLTNLSSNLQNQDFQDATRAMLYTWHGIGNPSPETFSGTYDHNRATRQPDTFHVGVLAVKEATAPVNNDPVLDSSEPDFSIGSDQSGVVGTVSGNVSDADGDPITYSIVSGAPAGITMAANGDISSNGSVVEGAYSITYQGDDLQGGTPAQDTFTLTVTPPALSVDSITPATLRVGDTATANVSNPAGVMTGSVPAGAVTADSQDGSSFVFTVFNPITFGNRQTRFEENITLTLDDGVNQRTGTFQIQKADNPDHFYAEVTAILGFYQDLPGIQVGGKIYAIRSGAFEYDPATGVVQQDNAGGSIEMWYQDPNDDVWGDSGVITIPALDSEDPVITLAGAGTIEIDEGGVYNEPGATWTDNVDGTGAVVPGGDTVDVNTPGTYIVTYDYTDAAGNSAVQLSRTVIVNDITPPAFALIGSNSVIHAHGTPWVDPSATAVDAVDGDVANRIVISGSVDFNAVGTYTLRYNVTDTAGNAAPELTRVVEVTDQAAPVVTLLGSATINLSLGQPFTDPGVTAIDAVDGNITGAVNITGSVDVNTPGSYPITYSSTDAANNTSQVVRTVVVAADVSIPTILLNGDATVYHPQNTPYSDLGATASDNLDGDISNSIITTGASFDFNVVGTYYVRYNVQDSSGNSANEVVRTVIVQDQTAPVISLWGGDMSVVQGSSFSDPGAAVSDNNDPSITVQVGGSVDVGTPGTYILTYDAEDAAGNVAVQRIRTVTVTPLVVVVDDDWQFQIISPGSTYEDPDLAFVADSQGANVAGTAVWGGETVDTDAPLVDQVYLAVFDGVVDDAAAGEVSFATTDTIPEGRFEYVARARDENGELVTFSIGTYTIN